MSTSSGKMHSRSHISEKAKSVPRHVEEGGGGPNTSRHRARNEQAASSNAVPLQPIPRLAPNDARHTINDNQAQRHSNASAPNLRGYLNNRRAESAPADDDEFEPRCFVSTVRNERPLLPPASRRRGR